MAMFREHIAVGALVSVGLAVVSYTHAVVTDFGLLAVMFIAGVVASFLPDVDSDTSLPFYLVFGTATVSVGGIALFYMLTTGPYDLHFVIGIPLLALLIMWFVVGEIFQRFTMHRGIFHSIPAALIVGVGTFVIARELEQGDIEQLTFAGFATVGYLSHLILDEFHAFVNLDGTPFVPKKSLGTATKLFSSAAWVNVVTYSILFGLLYIAIY